MPFIRSPSPRHSDPADIGIGAIKQIYDLWQIDDRWSVRDRRGFTWWAGHHRQHVYVDEGRDDYSAFVYRLWAVTELLSGVDPNATRTNHEIADLNTLSGAYALILDERTRTVSLSSSVLFHEDSADWVVPHFAALAITQVVDAEDQADTYAQMLGAIPNRSCHPRSGVRRRHDEMLGVIEDIYKAHGQEPSRWIGSGEFEEMLPALREAGFFLSAGGKYGLITQTEFATDSATIRATGSEPHHQLGNGLRLSLALPVVLREEAAKGLSNELNTAEAVSFTRSHFLGSWTATETNGGYVPEFVSFVPNVLYGPGLLFNLVLSLGLKARWVQNEIAPYAEAQERSRASSRRRFRARGEE